MSQKSATGHPFILHVAAPPDGSSANETHPVEKVLNFFSERVRRCPDVYRAAARLCAPSAEPPTWVFVCTDRLGNPELEFFSIVARHHRRLPVYVYGRDQSRSRIARAFQLGATGIATEPIARKAVESAEAEPRSSEYAPSPADEDATQQQFEPAGPAPEPEPEISEPQAAPARVPWVRYGDAPARKAPPREPGPSEPDAESHVERERSSLNEPLLSDAELQALIGEDAGDWNENGPESQARQP